MISPLGQRQILQTLAAETVRQAMEGGAQVQREQARKRAFDAKLVEAMEDVAEVAETESMKLSERQGQGGKQESATGASADEDEESPAEGAGPHLDLLA
jgi:hypothetical protein